MTNTKRSRRIGLLIGTAVVLAGFAYMISGGISSNLVYFLTPGELLARGEAGVDQPVRLGGQVAPNSVHWDAQALDLRFVLQDEVGEQIEVHASKAPPQMFREGIGVIVEGRLTTAGVFESSTLMVKHSNEYRPPEEGHDPQQLLKTLVREPSTDQGRP